MIDTSKLSLVRVKPIKKEAIPKYVYSCIGHQDTAVVVSGLLGFEVACNRVNLKLDEGDTLYVAQYKGPRLPEGATELPAGTQIDFLEVTVKESCKDCGSTDCGLCIVNSWTHGE